MLKKKKKKSWMLELEFLQNLCASLTTPNDTTRKAFTGTACVHVSPSKASMWFIVLGKPSGCRIDCRLLLICWEVTFYADVALFSFASSSSLGAAAAFESKLGCWWTELCFAHLQNSLPYFNGVQPLSLACKWLVNSKSIALCVLSWKSYVAVLTISTVTWRQVEAAW